MGSSTKNVLVFASMLAMAVPASISSSRLGSLSELCVHVDFEDAALQCTLLEHRPLIPPICLISKLHDLVFVDHNSELGESDILLYYQNRGL